MAQGELHNVLGFMDMRLPAQAVLQGAELERSDTNVPIGRRASLITV